MRFSTVLAAATLLVFGIASAPLPPETPFDGSSRELAVDADHEWATPFEKGGLVDSPDYAATVDWLRRLVAASDRLQLLSLGKSLEGRDIWMVVASEEGASTAQALRSNGKPTVLAQAGIHSGEIDGKDAGMMLLRDMTVRGERGELLDRCNLLFIPILNVDGHERSSEYSRINQRGPARQGWRTNRRNLNLNRDYAKLDTPEIRHVVRVINEWQPDLYLDLHVTDGADYQYDLTYGFNDVHGWSPAISKWLGEQLQPTVDHALSEAGHTPGPLIFSANGVDLSAGMVAWTAPPRFSNGYGDARHLPTVLLENHSLKSFDRRVFGTYVFLQACMRATADGIDALRAAVAADQARRIERIPVGWTYPSTPTGETISFQGVRSELFDSDISGGQVVRWTGEPIEQEIPIVRYTEPIAIVDRPSAYYIPASWVDIAQRLRLHGVQMELVQRSQAVNCQMLRLPDAQLDTANELPYEGHARTISGSPRIDERELVLPPGSYIVPTDQPLGTLVTLLLEPESPDSFFQWGFLLECLQRTEYAESYVMEPLARRMLEENPELKAEFEAALTTGPDLASDPAARLHWFYRRSPYFDAEFRLYPIGREP